MTDKNRSFPLPLSSVVDKGAKKATVFAPVATPQTATQNAARHVAPQHGYPNARPVAAPSKSHSYAMERAQPLPAPAPRQNPLVSEAVRRAMVQRVAKQGVKDAVVLGAMESVPRHMFMDEALASQAYIDASLPIGHHQTISQPYIVARMIEVMRNGGQLKNVLEIGTGCGYQAAVLACVAQQVYSIERIKPLHELAKSNLRPLRRAEPAFALRRWYAWPAASGAVRRHHPGRGRAGSAAGAAGAADHRRPAGGARRRPRPSIWN